MQGGTHAARTIRRRILGRPTEPFRYSNHGDVAVIGRLAGVTDIPWMGPFGQQSGFPAWLLWLLIHIAYLIGFANRIVVVTRWAFSFLTHGRSIAPDHRRATTAHHQRARAAGDRRRQGRPGGGRGRSRDPIEGGDHRDPALSVSPRGELEPERGAVRAGLARRRSCRGWRPGARGRS